MAGEPTWAACLISASRTGTRSTRCSPTSSFPSTSTSARATSPSTRLRAAWPSLPERAASRRSIQTELSNSRFIANMVTSDILIRWPKLNWVSVESGIGWIPYVLERVDYEYREEFVGMDAPELPPAKEMFQKGVYGTFWFETAGPLDLLNHMGEDNVMWRPTSRTRRASTPHRSNAPSRSSAPQARGAPQDHAGQRGAPVQDRSLSEAGRCRAARQSWDR